MKVLFSYPEKLKNEVQLINQIVKEDNWYKFHLRKPDWSDTEVNKLYEELDENVQKITVIHKNFKGSCHSFDDVEEYNKSVTQNEEYCFLSPVFDSISKHDYKANFEKNELKKFLEKERRIKIIGLGGVTKNNYSELIQLGFDGGAFLGSVWEKYA